MADDDVLNILVSCGFSAQLRNFSAVDSYLGRESGVQVQALTNADTADLARLFEELRYPGIDLADAALDRGAKTWYFHTESRRPSFTLLDFFQDWKTGRFYDPAGNYPLLRQIRKPVEGACPALAVLEEGLNPGVERNHALMDGALILAKYAPDGGSGGGIQKIAGLFRPDYFAKGAGEGPPPGIEEQRLLLSGLLIAPNPGLGLTLLKNCGFIGKYWPELAVLDDVDQSKEFHPEGNAWTHTMETFRYRKTGRAAAAYSLRLSLGLLLHDIGKPIAGSAGSRRFDGHAELGERQARRFLERLGFDAALTGDVCYLVRNHMLPAALPRLPLARTGEIMASPLFPVLLELYRCDESSSFKGLDGYYESSAAYQDYLRNRRNPYRTADGKKLNHCRISNSKFKHYTE